MARKMTNIEIAEAIALLKNDHKTARRPIKTGSAAANIDKWLAAATLQPPVLPQITREPDGDRRGSGI